ncbi:bifunctional diguanylate cyclase/phosphodiesterase [Paenibacillus sedimenti]|uniref:EAL domain-containing protein n=1 Tax=Paenibacillus sedimenti TaxID=2770274 RepID=A0A926QIY0_9BACL|nr:EAL domain-containing protein [Paenibacillus sedimenti]MBD0379959.1 EAL domain-containing protein [Paenibacillus sedimenti]
MRVHQLQYRDCDHLIGWMDEREIRDSKQLLVQVYTYTVHSESIANLISLLHTNLPQATLIGCTSDGQILDGQVCERSTILSFIQFEKTDLHSSLFEFTKETDCFENGRAFANQLVVADTKACIVFTDAISNPEDFIKGIEFEAPHVVLAGGISRNMLGQTALFSKQGLITEGAVGVSLSGQDLLANNSYSLNWKLIGKNFKVTHADGNRIYSIDNMSVIDLYRKYLGEKIAMQITEKSSQFPLILKRNGIHICRDVLAVHEEGSVTVSGHLYEGEIVRFGFGDPELIVDGSKQLIESMQEISAEAILIYSCEARRRFMFNSIGYELSPLQQVGPNIGFFTSGEFYHHEQKNMIINHSMTLLMLSENPQVMPKGNIFLQQHEQENQWGELDALRAMSHLAQVSTDELMKLNVSLEASEQRYRSLVQYNPDVVYSIDAKGTLLSLNPTFYDLLGYEEDEVSSLFEVVDAAESSRIQESITYAFQGHSQTFELSLMRKDRTMIPFMITQIPIVVNQEFVGVYGIAKNISERKEAEARITFMAYHDVLTELPNRTLLYKQLNDLLQERSGNRQMFAVMFIDLDNFKEMNDSFGHFVGDDILKRFAGKLRQLVTEKGQAARFGGDEFAVILDMNQIREIEDVAGQVVEYFKREPIILEGTEQFITTSVGLSLYPNDGDTPELLLRNADLAMYKAKQSGKNRYLFYVNEISDELREKRLLVSDLRKAIAEDELEVYYQPLIDLKTQHVIGSEALVRWMHKELGQVSPSVFIPIAEEYGLIDILGYWVLKTACIQNVRWKDKYDMPLIISVNVSYQQFQRNDFVDVVKEVLQETGLDPVRLHLEITESTALINLEHTRLILRRLQHLGVSISMDDFGTGYSSLSCVKDLSIDKLKIDRSFITNISTDVRDAAIVKTIIALSRNLNMKVLAEGVERKEQLDKLAEYECDEIQGYLFSPPLSSRKFEECFLAPG